ncbi:MAG: hypothetical protein K8S24_05315 [Candidatus Aegiribacteria sp.]|nr:hypothetical protein [Candidatus Aegiribacteria sp.]
MKWKVIVKGDEPSEKSVLFLTERTGLLFDKILRAFSHENEIVCNGLSEGEAQELADSLRRDPGIHCRILPDHEEEVQPVPLFRVLLINYRPGYRTRLRRRLQDLTHLPQEQIVLWLSRMPIALSKGIDSETAKSVKKSITEAGGIVRIEAESLLQESVLPRRRSNAVFRTSTHPVDSDDDISDTLFGNLTDTADDDDSRIPPVSGLPEQYSIGPPPIDEFETSYGRIFLQPPDKYTLGLPSKSLDGGFLETPPVLPDVSNRSIPEAIEFSPPEIAAGNFPPVVGNREQNSLTSGPTPDIVILYAPAGSIFQHLLLPPVLEKSRKDLFKTEDDLPDDAETSNNLESEKNAIRDVFTSVRNRNRRHTRESNDSEDAVLKLVLCTPAPENEDRVAKALCDVIGISLRESWDLLRKTPSLLEVCKNHKRAIKMAHELDSRGVTVSLTRGSLNAEIPPVIAGEGFQAWLSKNG